jgi:hypothetical protein
LRAGECTDGDLLTLDKRRSLYLEVTAHLFCPECAEREFGPPRNSD